MRLRHTNAAREGIVFKNYSGRYLSKVTMYVWNSGEHEMAHVNEVQRLYIFIYLVCIIKLADMGGQALVIRTSCHRLSYPLKSRYCQISDNLGSDSQDGHFPPVDLHNWAQHG